MNVPLLPCLTQTKSFLLGGCATLLAATPLSAQNRYTVVDLTAANGRYGIAYAASSGRATGAISLSSQAYVGAPNVDFASPRAALWTGDGATDLHPALLLGGDVTNSISMALGFAGNLEVGMGFGPNTQGHNVALAWNDTAASVQIASSLRNVGRLAGALALLSAELNAASDDLDNAVRDFLALVLTDLGREREAMSIGLTALSHHLPRYN